MWVVRKWVWPKQNGEMFLRPLSKVTQIGVKEEACEESVCCVCGGDDFLIFSIITQHAQITGVARVPEWEGPIRTSIG